MKWGKLLLGVGWACVLYACSDDDGKDDTIMNMSELTGKYWYYNAWLGDKYGMGQSDLLEVIRFEKGGVLKMMEFGGRRVHAIGTWTGGDNQITMDLDDGDSIVWNVQRSGPDYIQTIVNAQGERKYTTDPGYLGELTADAFLVNEYTDGNQFKTYIGVDVRGNKNVKEVALIPADGKSIPVENHGYFWSERQPQSGDYVDFGGEKREVRFYLRIGKNTQLKLQDTIYSQNLPQRTLSESGLEAITELGTGALKVSWNSYQNPDIYYRVEIFSKKMDLTQPYFVSRIQPATSTRMTINTTTSGEVNRIGELIKGESYQVRLTALMFEPGVDVINDEYSFANLQAVTYFSRGFLWE